MDIHFQPWDLVKRAVHSCPLVDDHWILTTGQCHRWVPEDHRFIQLNWCATSSPSNFTGSFSGSITAPCATACALALIRHCLWHSLHCWCWELVLILDRRLTDRPLTRQNAQIGQLICNLQYDICYPSCYTLTERDLMIDWILYHYWGWLIHIPVADVVCFTGGVKH